MDKIKSVAGHAKDVGSSAAIRLWLAHEVASFGELKGFSINSRDKSARLELLLKGETLPIVLEILEYDLVETMGKPFLLLKRVRASREWLAALLDRFLVGRPYPLPAQHQKVLLTVLRG
jgi:hypothetical protein